MPRDYQSMCEFGLYGYRRHVQCAEAAATDVLDSICKEAGHMLYNKYIERKAFGFAAQASTEALVCDLAMCYVPHEGERCVQSKEGDGMSSCSVSDSEWEIEEEPTPMMIDSWARMRLQVLKRPRRDLMVEDPPSPQSRNSPQMVGSQGGSMSSWNAASSLNSPKKGKSKTIAINPEPSEPAKMFPLVIETPVDEEEDRLRDAKLAAEAKKREFELHQRHLEMKAEEERREIERNQNELANKQFAFDSDGNLIWVESPNPEKLPPTMEQFKFKFCAGRRSGPRELDTTSSMMATSKSQPPSPVKSPKSPKRNRGSRRQQHLDPEFPDGFSKLKHMQPPILDTMLLRPGVVLETSGKTKKGGPVSKVGHMTREQYLRQAAIEVGSAGASADGPTEPASPPPPSNPLLPGGGGDGRGGGGGSGGGAASSKNHPPARMSEEHAHKPRAAWEEAASPDAANEASRSPQLGKAPEQQNQQQMQRSPSDSSNRRLPAVLPMEVHRSRRHLAVGHLGRLPRFHPSPLGSPTGVGAAQPTLGATMGHGLLSTSMSKEVFFFPSLAPDLPKSLRRSSSEAAVKDLLSAWERGQRREGGCIVPEIKSPAYQNVHIGLSSNGSPRRPSIPR